MMRTFGDTIWIAAGLIGLAVMPAITRADTAGIDMAPMFLDACDPFTGAQRDIYGQMQPAAGPIPFNMAPLLNLTPSLEPVGAGFHTVKPAQLPPVSLPATIALLAPVLAIGAWLATRRRG